MSASPSTPTETPLEEAAKNFLAYCWEALADNAASFSCGEADYVVALFEANDDYDSAVEFLVHHARGDSDESDTHHDLFLKHDA